MRQSLTLAAFVQLELTERLDGTWIIQRLKQTGGGRPRPRHLWLFFPLCGRQAGALFGGDSET